MQFSVWTTAATEVVTTRKKYLFTIFYTFTTVSSTLDCVRVSYYCWKVYLTSLKVLLKETSEQTFLNWENCDVSRLHFLHRYCRHHDHQYHHGHQQLSSHGCIVSSRVCGDQISLRNMEWVLQLLSRMHCKVKELLKFFWINFIRDASFCAATSGGWVTLARVWEGNESAGRDSNFLG